MGQAISAVLTFAVGVAISPVPIIAVILMLFSARARVNGPAFLAGWVLALAVVCAVAYTVADGANASTSSTATDSIAWGKVVLGVVLLAGGLRRWRGRPGPDDEPEMPKWMAGIDSLAPGKAFGLGVLLAGVNPKNLVLTLAAATSVAQLPEVSGSDATVALIVFVVLASVTIAGPVLYSLVGGEHARRTLDGMKDWLRTHNAAVMAVLLLVFGVDLIAKGLPPITG
jgi:threonine/homoserine/homoserine lactone efflux protein